MFRISLLFLLIVFFVGCSEPYIDSPEPKPKLSVFTHFGIPPTKSDRHDSPFAMSQDPTFKAETLYRFSLAASKIGKQAQAIVLLEEAIELASSNAVYQFELGNLYISSKEYIQALTHIEVANALEPNKPRVLAALGYTWFNLQDNEKAVLFLEQAVKIAPTFALGWYHLGNAQVALGDKNSAIESFKVAIQLQSTFKQAKEALNKVQGR
jgi:tetratricopeptide (TPR) repeat protein